MYQDYLPWRNFWLRSTLVCEGQIRQSGTLSTDLKHQKVKSTDGKSVKNMGSANYVWKN